MIRDISLLATTHGSLPYMDPDDAIDEIIRYTPDMPTWPQLPKIGYKHNMIAQFAHDIPGAVIDEETRNVFLDVSSVPANDLESYYERLLGEDPTRFSLDEDHFPGLHHLAARSAQLKSAKAVKGHMSGPVTMGTQILTGDKTPVLYGETEMELLLKALKMKGRWQQEFLQKFNPNTILIVDEPSLTLLGSPCVPIQKESAANLINEVMGGIGGLKGIHCCGNTDWGALMDLDIDVLSFDAYSFADTLALYTSDVESFLSRGGRLAWGITPTSDANIERETVDTLMTRFHEGVGQLVDKGIGVNTILDSSLITPACGLGMVTPANAVKALNLTSELSFRLRKQYAGGGM